MYGWRGIASGALALVILQVVVSGSAPQNVGGVFDFVNELARRFIDPTVPAIPARTAAPQAPPAGATSGGGGTAPATPSAPSAPAAGAPAGGAPSVMDRIGGG